MHAGEVVLKLTLRTLDETEAFSGFLGRFLTAVCEAVDRVAAPCDPPFMMVSSEPLDEVDLRTVTFRETALADAFARGWDRARGGSRALRLP